MQYTIKELLNNYQVIVPQLQRDYALEIPVMLTP